MAINQWSLMKSLCLSMDALFLYSGLAKAEESDESESEVTHKKKKGKGKKGKKVKSGLWQVVSHFYYLSEKLFLIIVSFSFITHFHAYV